MTLGRGSHQWDNAVKIAVISDLHLGGGDRADRFGHDDAEFLRFLDFLEANFERIVLLGDIYETLTSPRPGRQLAALKQSKTAHGELVARFDRAPYRYIHGNHDLVTAHVDNAPSGLHIEANGTRILFTHGHAYDWITQNARWLSEWSVWAVGWMMRMGLTPVAKGLDSLDNLLTGVSRDPEKCGFQKWAVNLARRHNADIVVTGHTHIASRAEHGDRLFLNSGSCAQGNYSFLSLDTSLGNFGIQSSF